MSPTLSRRIWSAKKRRFARPRARARHEVGGILVKRSRIPRMAEDNRRSRWTEIALLGALGVMLVATNRWITFIDDETSIITTAAQPLRATLHAFWIGEGLHEHPPLYDVLLHFWLSITRDAWGALRLPAIACYLLGLWLLARAAEEIGGRRGAWAVLWIGALWPFGFHYGRLAAWYSFCFLMVAWLTLAYLRLLRQPNSWLWCGFLMSAAALIYTNYFGWAFLGCLAADYIVRKRGARLRALGVAGACTLFLAIAYLPLWRPFLNELRNGTSFAQPFTTKCLLGGFHLYNAFVSESAAPWVLWLGIPAVICVAACLALVLIHAPPEARKFLLYALVLIAAMAALSIISAKRMLPVTAWLLLPVSVAAGAMTRGGRGGARLALIGSLAGIAAIGWFGIFSREYYSAPRFIEPWGQVAAEAAARAESGSFIVGNNPSFFFYLSYALPAQPQAMGESDVTHVWQPSNSYGVFDAGDWIDARFSHRGHVYFVRGAPGPLRAGPAWDAEQWLDRRCRLESEKQMLRDPASSLKAGFFPELGDLPWRVRIREYTCGSGGRASL
jgi:Dolichyl-phosphate-mannose-protein mannosyltransferase